MIKARFGGYVRGRTERAQVNEVLAKVLCHNIVVLIQSIYELGLVPDFFTSFSNSSLKNARGYGRDYDLVVTIIQGDYALAT
jgi:hypothetical protein